MVLLGLSAVILLDVSPVLPAFCLFAATQRSPTARVAVLALFFAESQSDLGRNTADVNRNISDVWIVVSSWSALYELAPAGSCGKIQFPDGDIIQSDELLPVSAKDLSPTKESVNNRWTPFLRNRKSKTNPIGPYLKR